MEIDIVVLATGAITAIGGWVSRWIWDFYKYRKMRLSEYVLLIKLIPEVYHSGKLKLVDVTIQIQNVGKGAAFIKCPDPKKSQNPILEVKAVPIGTEDSVIEWGNLPPLFPPIEFLKDFYFPYPDEPYIIEPGDTSTEHACFTTALNGLLFLRITMWDQKGFMNWEQKIIDLRKATSCSTA